MAVEVNINEKKLFDYCLSGSIFSSAVKTIKDTLLEDVVNNNGEVEIPTNEYLFGVCPQYKNDCISTYDSRFRAYNIGSIPSNIKASQGSLLHGILMGYDLNTGVRSIFTLDSAFLGITDPSNINTKILNANLSGNLFAYRLDLVDYTSDITVKVVNMRSELSVEGDEFVLIPLASLYLFSSLFEKLIGPENKGTVYKTEQGSKTRYVSTNLGVLKAHSDMPETVTSARFISKPFMGYILAPVVGAPAYTAGYTKLDILNLDVIEMVGRTGVLPKENTGTNTMLSILAENRLASYLVNLSIKDYDTYFNLVQNLVSLGLENPLSGVDISRWLRDTPNGLNILLSVMPTGFKTHVKDLYNSFDGSNIVGKEYRGTSDNLKELLNNHLCRVVSWNSKHTGFTVNTVTNNRAILNKVYQNPSSEVYESTAFKLRKAIKGYLNEGRGLNATLCKYNLIKDEATAQTISANLPRFTDEDELFDFLVKTLGIKIRNSSSTNDSILARGISGYIDKQSKVNDYYVSINPSRVLKVYVMY